ncbi:MAG: aminotransferase class V-fold PLP-dependent enzyme [Thermoplasmata archaeon]|nr:MAG: aminotransferase class V-fold PLP-dependent enzyme [Thermoplasmata archaeon]
MLDSKVIRQLFPFLQESIDIKACCPNNNKRIVVDNTASTQLPLPLLHNVINSVFSYANIHRGEYSASLHTSYEFERAYNIAANLINARSWREIIFGRNTTEMINLVMRALQDDFRDGDNIVVTRLEHNSNYVPWYGLQQGLAKRQHPINIDIRVVNFERESAELDMKELESKVDDRTKMVAATGGSNFMGVRPDIKRIGEIAHESGYQQPGGEMGSFFLVDGAQLVPANPVDVQEIRCDFLAWSFHKMAIPLGVGGLFTKSEIIETLPPFLYGGDMIEEVAEGDVTFKERPWRYTAGTPNILGTIATGCGICFLVNLGLGNLFLEDKVAEEEKIELTGRKIETEILLNTPRGDFEIDYKVPEEYIKEWGQYLERHPEVESELKDRKMRLIKVREVVNTAMTNIKLHEEELTQRAIDGLSKIPNVSIYGPKDAKKRVGLVAFNIEGLEPDAVALKLDKYGVEVRSGTHCACLAHRHIGIEGSVRMSFYVYNTLEEVDEVVRAVSEVSKSAVKISMVSKPAQKASRSAKPLEVKA